MHMLRQERSSAPAGNLTQAAPIGGPTMLAGAFLFSRSEVARTRVAAAADRAAPAAEMRALRAQSSFPASPTQAAAPSGT